MTKHENTVSEILPVIESYVDDEGDIRHIDDNPDGFAAEGYTPKGVDYFRNDAVVATDHETDTPVVLGVSVDLGLRATNLLLATDSFAKASMLRGFLRANDREKIREYGGEPAIQASIGRNLERGRKALRAGSGIDAMLADPDMVPDEYGLPYNAQQATDDLVMTQRDFRETYTAEGVRVMQNATAREKIQKSKEINANRHSFRRVLARQAIKDKTQS